MPYAPTNLYPRNMAIENTSNFTFLGNIDRQDIVNNVEVELINPKGEVQAIISPEDKAIYIKQQVTPQGTTDKEEVWMEKKLKENSFSFNAFPINGYEDSEIRIQGDLAIKEGSSVELKIDSANASLQLQVKDSTKFSNGASIYKLKLPFNVYEGNEVKSSFTLYVLFSRGNGDYDDKGHRYFIYGSVNELSKGFNSIWRLEKDVVGCYTKTPSFTVSDSYDKDPFREPCFTYAKDEAGNVQSGTKSPDVELLQYSISNLTQNTYSLNKAYDNINNWYYWRCYSDVIIPNINVLLSVNINGIKRTFMVTGNLHYYFQKDDGSFMKIRKRSSDNSWYMQPSNDGKVPFDPNKQLWMNTFKTDTNISELLTDFSWRFLLHGASFDTFYYKGEITPIEKQVQISSSSTQNRIYYKLFSNSNFSPFYVQDKKSQRLFKRSVKYSKLYWGEICSVTQNYSADSQTYTYTIEIPSDNLILYTDDIFWQSSFYLGGQDITSESIKRESNQYFTFTSSVPYILANETITQSIFVSIEREDSYYQLLQKGADISFFVDTDKQYVESYDEGVLHYRILSDGYPLIDNSNPKELNEVELYTNEMNSMINHNEIVNLFDLVYNVSQSFKVIHIASSQTSRLKKYQIFIYKGVNLVHQSQEIYGNAVDYHWKEAETDTAYTIFIKIETIEGLKKVFKQHFETIDYTINTKTDQVETTDFEVKIKIPQVPDSEDIDDTRGSFKTDIVYYSFWRDNQSLVHNKPRIFSQTYFIDYGRKASESCVYEGTHTSVGHWEKDGVRGEEDVIVGSYMWKQEVKEPSEWLGTTLFGTKYNPEENEQNVYEVDPEQIWYFNLDTKSGNIDFTTEHNIYATSAQHPRVGISNTNYMKQTVTTKLGYLNEDDMYVGDNGEKLTRFSKFANNGLTKILRLPNGYLIPVNIQLTTSAAQQQLVGQPTDITFQWTQIKDHESCVLYGLD